jgi:hypothetical protein
MSKPPPHFIVVRTPYDPDTKVWWIENSDPLHGLNLEAATIDELRSKLPAAIIDLLETEIPDADVVIEIICHAHTKLRIPNGPVIK